MYQNKMVVAIKTNGKVLRETGDAVHIPYGCEYQIHIKNLNSKRASVKVWIDGQDATEGTGGLLVDANGAIDFKRFIKDGNLEAGNSFKFIERTSKIENGPRGIKAEDGLIRIEFEYERDVPKTNWNGPYFSSPAFGDEVCRSIDFGPYRNMIGSGPKYSSAIYYPSGLGSATLGSTTIQASVNTHNAMPNEIGITVPGSINDQSFRLDNSFVGSGTKEVMVLRLLGDIGGVPVKAPITVKTKPKCETCGTVNKAGSKFCKECGTCLAVI